MERYRLSTVGKQHALIHDSGKLVPLVDIRSCIGGDCTAVSVGNVCDAPLLPRQPTAPNG